MNPARKSLLAASAAVVAFALFLTWPQSLYLGTKVSPHNDPYFSMWRLAWIAHALRADPHHLYDANIYYPEPRVLAYSDAMMLEGAIAAPFLWAGTSVVLVYNVLLLVGIAGSGLAMFVLVRHLTQNNGAALVSAAIFTLAPYRVQHYMHLELQWTMWIPLAFWAAHRAVDEGSWRFGALAGVFVWLQIVSCLYYGIFLAMMVALVGGLLAVTNPRRAPIGLATLALGGVLATVLTIPYALPYIDNASVLGARPSYDVTRYSARLLSYFTTSWQNWLWGWTADRFDNDELSVAPGLVALVLAVCGLFSRRRRLALLYASVCLTAVEISLGTNGHVFPWLRDHVLPFRGLRAMARFSIVACAGVAVLAGFGIEYLQQFVRRQRAREWVAAVAIVLVTLESGSAPMPLRGVLTTPPDVYRAVSRLPSGVVAEFPMAEPSWFPGFDPFYEYFSRAHWKPLVNGYSGYASARYFQILEQMLTFPDDASIANLRKLKVRYVLIHEALYEPSQVPDLLIKLARRRELIPMGRFKDWVGGNTALFELQ